MAATQPVRRRPVCGGGEVRGVSGVRPHSQCKLGEEFGSCTKFSGKVLEDFEAGE